VEEGRRLEAASGGAVPGTRLIRELEAIGRTVRFCEGDRVMVEGQPGKGIYILRSGSARVSMAAHNGETIELRTLQHGDFIGLSSTLSCEHCCYSVESSRASEFTFVQADRAHEFLRSRPDLCLEVIQLLGQEMSALCNERAILNATKPVQIER